MKEITPNECKWCHGSGIDAEGVQLGNPYPCTECRGTGFEDGEEGKTLFFKQMNELEKELIEKDLL